MGYPLRICQPKQKFPSAQKKPKPRPTDNRIAGRLREAAIDYHTSMMIAARTAEDFEAIRCIMKRLPNYGKTLLKKKKWSLTEAIYMCHCLGIYLNISIDNGTVDINWERTKNEAR